MSALPNKKGLSLLDLGCGPGRDLLYFNKEGHHAIGLDGSYEFCEMAKSLTGLQVLQQDFLKLELPEQFVDGIFANASLFHVPSQEMIRVLKQLRSALKPKGVLFSSNPRGNTEGWQGDRYGTYLTRSLSATAGIGRFRNHKTLLSTGGTTLRCTALACRCQSESDLIGTWLARAPGVNGTEEHPGNLQGDPLRGPSGCAAQARRTPAQRISASPARKGPSPPRSCSDPCPCRRR